MSCFGQAVAGEYAKMLKVSQSSVLNVARRAYRFPGQTVEKLSRKNYYAARAYYHYKLARADAQCKEPPLLVYQMGKVGSTTVVAALRTTRINRRIYQLHILAPEVVGKFEIWRKTSFPQINDDLKYVWRCQYIYKRVQRGLSGKKWKIITLVRDPIARNISDFFQNIEVTPLGSDREWRLRSEWYDFESTINNDNVQELIEIFFERYRHDAPSIWFDREFKGVLDIDIYANDFSTSKGYKIYEEESADVLLIRLENLGDCAAEAFKAFLDVDNLTLRSKNVGSRKDYADIYRTFRDSIVFPAVYLDEMYSSRFARHFYSEAEIERFRATWSKARV
jgi:hypothetical protein